MTEREQRIITTKVEIRSEEGQPTKMIGYAAKFNRWSKPIYGLFIERLDPHCFDETDMNDVVALVNHDTNKVLGRAGVNVQLTVDEIGLRFEITPTDTSYARDLAENMRAGVIKECSFAFSIPENGDEIARYSDKLTERTIKKIDTLYDISIVTNPAYSDTEAVLSQRSLERYQPLANDEEKIKQLEMEMQVYG